MARHDATLLADGFEAAVLGVVHRCGQVPVVVYDRDKCLLVLQRRDGMSYQDAEEYFSFNVEGAWVGQGTPAFLERLTLAEIEERMNA